MARYSDSVCRLCRREGEALFLKGARCFKDKCAIKRRNQIPGQHGGSTGGRPKKPTNYAIQLRAKQRVRRIYGVLERQFQRYYGIAVAMPGNTGTNLLQVLEQRLDSVLYRMGFGMSRAQCRMWCTQAHFEVNNHSVNIPSYSVKPGDVIAVREKSGIRKTLRDLFEAGSGREKSRWVEVDSENLKGKFVSYPERTDLDPKIQENLIVEYYSR